MGFVFVWGEPSQKESLRTVVLFSHFSLCPLCFLFHCSCHQGFFIWGLGLFRRGENECRAPISTAGVWVTPVVFCILCLCRAEDETSGFPKLQRFFPFCQFIVPGKPNSDSILGFLVFKTSIHVSHEN